MTVIESDLSCWETELISYDEIKDLTLQDDIVTGLSLDIINDADEWEWVGFRYDINSKTLTGGRIQTS